MKTLKTYVDINKLNVAQKAQLRKALKTVDKESTQVFIDNEGFPIVKGVDITEKHSFSVEILQELLLSRGQWRIATLPAGSYQGDFTEELEEKSNIYAESSKEQALTIYASVCLFRESQKVPGTALLINPQDKIVKSFTL